MSSSGPAGAVGVMMVWRLAEGGNHRESTMLPACVVGYNFPMEAKVSSGDVDELTDACFVVRQAGPTSRRELVLALSAEGRRVVQTATRRRREIRKIVSRMPAETRAGLVDALTAFTEAGGEPVVRDDRTPLGTLT